MKHSLCSRTFWIGRKNFKDSDYYLFKLKPKINKATGKIISGDYFAIIEKHNTEIITDIHLKPGEVIRCRIVG